MRLSNRSKYGSSALSVTIATRQAEAQQAADISRAVTDI